MPDKSNWAKFWATDSAQEAARRILELLEDRKAMFMEEALTAAAGASDDIKNPVIKAAAIDTAIQDIMATTKTKAL
jgi:hypothetical protein